METLFCALLRPLLQTCVCALLRLFACFCVRQHLERQRWGISEQGGYYRRQNDYGWPFSLKKQKKLICGGFQVFFLQRKQMEQITGPKHSSRQSLSHYQSSRVTEINSWSNFVILRTCYRSPSGPLGQCFRKCPRECLPETQGPQAPECPRSIPRMSQNSPDRGQSRKI